MAVCIELSILKAKCNGQVIIHILFLLLLLIFKHKFDLEFGLMLPNKQNW